MSGFPQCVCVCVCLGRRGSTWVHRLKVNVPYQHKKEHMSSAVPNYCHIEQFKHLICTKYTLRETGGPRGCCRDCSRVLVFFLLRTAASLDETHVPRCADARAFYIPGERCVLVKMRLVCVCVLAFVCHRSLRGQLRGSITVSLNDDGVHAPAHGRHFENHTFENKAYGQT